MKTTKQLLALVAFVCFSLSLFAQQPGIQYFRPWDKTGINVFEPAKGGEQPEYEGLSVRIGGSFTQQYQDLTHSTTAPARNQTIGNTTYNLNEPFRIAPGFNLATANLNFDFQIEDGIRVCLENYMSARHHPEFWVKGGYIQMDKLPMFGNPEWFEKYFRVKIGHFQVNYGDQQFRRTDNGNAIYNAFVGNYILDAFTTEIGSEIYAFPAEGLMVMAGMTSGFINGNIQAAVAPTKRNPSVYFKAAYDKQVNEDFRFRLSASMYNNSNHVRNTLYAGDRTGSRYYMVMEPHWTITSGVAGVTSATNNFTSGRINPGVTNKVNAIQINPFVKFGGLEFFGAYETISGKASATEASERDWTQLAGELIYRFANENIFVGAKYNTVSGTPQGFTSEVEVSRTSFSAGWFPTKNLLLKGEIVNQKYEKYPTTSILNGGEFKGFVIEAVVGF